MKYTPKQIATFAAVSVVLAAVSYWAGTHVSMAPKGPGIEKPLAAGAPAPEFTLAEYQSNKPVALADYKGKAVLVNFWATWCPPCQEEIPGFIKVRNELAPKGFEILGISLDQGGASDIAPFARDKGITYPVLLGTQEVVTKYGGIRGIPTSFLVDRQGRIVKMWQGAIPEQELRGAVGPLLQG